MAPTFLSLFFLFFTIHLLSAQSSSMESVPDLQNTMYTIIDGYPCVRLLNLSGTIGCSNPGRDKVVAPIVRFENVDEISKPSAILVSFDEFPTLFTRISEDLSFASKVGGVLVESRTNLQDKLKGFSPDKKFPEAEFSPYHNISYEWNPIGSGIMWKSYNFPVFLLTESGSKTLQEVLLSIFMFTLARD